MVDSRQSRVVSRESNVESRKSRVERREPTMPTRQDRTSWMAWLAVAALAALVSARSPAAATARDARPFAVVLVSANAEWKVVKAAYARADLHPSPWGESFETLLPVGSQRQLVVF